MFAFRSFRRNRRFDTFFALRKPRHRVLRVVLTLFGVALLAVLLLFGLAIGAAMLTAGLLYRLWKQRNKPLAAGAPLEGQYRVVRRPALTVGR